MKYFIKSIEETCDNVFEEVEEVIKSPPSTWIPYIQRKDYIGIITMEFNELKEAELVDRQKECIHLMASVLKYMKTL
jgi:hypothetical protein